MFASTQSHPHVVLPSTTDGLLSADGLSPVPLTPRLTRGGTSLDAPGPVPAATSPAPPVGPVGVGVGVGVSVGRDVWAGDAFMGPPELPLHALSIETDLHAQAPLLDTDLPHDVAVGGGGGGPTAATALTPPPGLAPPPLPLPPPPPPPRTTRTGGAAAKRGAARAGLTPPKMAAKAHAVPGATLAKRRKRVGGQVYNYAAEGRNSRHCHICAKRFDDWKELMGCSNCHVTRSNNAKIPLCKKSVCIECFARHEWNWKDALHDPAWVCTHCAGICPPRAQCFVYRKSKNARAAAAAAASRGAGGGKGGKKGHGYGAAAGGGVAAAGGGGGGAGGGALAAVAVNGHVGGGARGKGKGKSKGGGGGKGKGKGKASRAATKRYGSPRTTPQDDAEDARPAVMRDLKERDFWERFERRLYEERREKKKASKRSSKAAAAAKAPTPEEEALARLCASNVYGPPPPDVAADPEWQAAVAAEEADRAARVKQRAKLHKAARRRMQVHVPSVRKVGIGLEYNRDVSRRFFARYKKKRLADAWDRGSDLHHVLLADMERSDSPRPPPNPARRAPPPVAMAPRKPAFNMQLHLKKYFNKLEWRAQERRWFTELFALHGRDWRRLSQLMGGTKSPTAVKNFYYQQRLHILQPLVVEGDPWSAGSSSQYRPCATHHVLVDPSPAAQLADAPVPIEVASAPGTYYKHHVVAHATERPARAAAAAAAGEPGRYAVGEFAFAYMQSVDFAEGGWFEVQVLGCTSDSPTRLHYQVHIPGTPAGAMFTVNRNFVRRTLEAGMDVWAYGHAPLDAERTLAGGGSDALRVGAAGGATALPQHVLDGVAIVRPAHVVAVLLSNFERMRADVLLQTLRIELSLPCYLFDRDMTAKEMWRLNYQSLFTAVPRFAQPLTGENTLQVYFDTFMLTLDVAVDVLYDHERVLANATYQYAQRRAQGDVAFVPPAGSYVHAVNLPFSLDMCRAIEAFVERPSSTPHRGTLHASALLEPPPVSTSKASKAAAAASAAKRDVRAVVNAYCEGTLHGASLKLWVVSQELKHAVRKLLRDHAAEVKTHLTDKLLHSTDVEEMLAHYDVLLERYAQYKERVLRIASERFAVYRNTVDAFRSGKATAPPPPPPPAPVAS